MPEPALIAFLALFVSAASFIVSALALKRAESARTAAQQARPGQRLREPVTVIRDALEAVIPAPQLWAGMKVAVGESRKATEAELPGVLDDELRRALAEVSDCIQQAFEAGATGSLDSFGRRVGADDATLIDASRRGEIAAKGALNRIAWLDSRQ